MNGRKDDEPLDPISGQLTPRDIEERRRFLVKLSRFSVGALGFLQFPGAAAASQHSGELGGPGGLPVEGLGSEGMGSLVAGTFPNCDPFNEYSGGTDCTGAYTCQSSFHCEGGVDDDFECVSTFACPVFACSYSFDGEDCETYFRCGTSTFDCGDDPFTCTNNYSI